MKPEESVKDALNNTEENNRKLQSQVELPVPRGESAKSAVATPIKILKSESTFAKSFGQKGYVNGVYRY